jgi:hypothetical protein
MTSKLNTERTIALYSSDATVLYKADVFRTLALPKEYTIQFRYDKTHVSPELLKDIESLRNKPAIVIFLSGNDQSIAPEKRQLDRHVIRRCLIRDAFEDETTQLLILILELKDFLKCDLSPILASSSPYFVSDLSLPKASKSSWFERVESIENHFPDTLFFTISEILHSGCAIRPTYDSKRRISLFKLEEERDYTVSCSCYDRKDGSSHLKIDNDSADIYFTNLFRSGVGARRDPRWLPLTTGTLKTRSVPTVLRFSAPSSEEDEGVAEDPNAVNLYFLLIRNKLKVSFLGLLSAAAVFGAILTQFSFKDYQSLLTSA